MIKRRVLCLLMVLMLSLVTTGGTFALADDATENIPPASRGAITLYAGLDNLGSGSYRARATIETSATESLKVSFSLYKVVNGSEQFVTSASNSGTGRKVMASKTVSLSSGTYHMYYSGSGNTVSDSDDMYFYI